MGQLIGRRDPSARTRVGTVLDGAYRLDRVIGEGGMGAVYEALQVRLNKRVAVKVMAEQLAGNAEALARFRREVQITTQLAHPHVIQVFDFGTSPSGEPFLVMEYLEGEDLEQRLARVGQMPLAATAHVIKQSAAALAATHAKGIIHRDLKPANIVLLDVEGTTDFVKLVDFGISKVKSSSSNLTKPSVMMGTPKYMAPEQASGKTDSVDHRSDQWALACIAWEMLSGREPFVAEDVPTLMTEIIHGDLPPLTSKGGRLVPDVEVTLRRALSKRQSDRFPTITAFARALSNVAATTEQAVTPPPVRVAASKAQATPRPVRKSPNGGLPSVDNLLDRALRRRKPSVVDRTMALGQRALDAIVPSRRKKPWYRRAWPYVFVGLGTAVSTGAFYYLWASGFQLPKL